MASLFNDDFYYIMGLSENQDDLVNIYNHNDNEFCQLFLYNKDKHKDFIGLKYDLKENIICPGIVIKENNNVYDIIMKNYLTTDPIIISPKYINNEKYIYAYVKNIFDRFISKYKREATLGIQDIYYQIPPIGLLDYILTKIDIFFNTLDFIYNDQDKFENFKNRFYKQGLIGEYKGKYYQWLPKQDNTREILNLKPLKSYNILPAFSIQYKV